MAEDYLRDEDLLSILEESVEEDKTNKTSKSDEGISEVEKLMSSDKDTSTESIDTAISVKDVQAIAESFNKISGNKGSGNLDTDLSNWFEGVDDLPSDALNNNVANASVKLDYGLTHSTLTSFKLMNKLRKFIEEDAFDLLFSENAILGIDSEEVLDRVKTAFTMYKELGSLTQRTVQSMREYKYKTGSEGTDVDRLTMLLSTIPSDKLESTLKEIAFGDEKK